MPRVHVVFIFVILGGAFTSPALGKECICLRNIDTGAIVRGCEEFRAESNQFSVAYCTNTSTWIVDKYIIDFRWEKIKEGEDRCDPCNVLGNDLPVGREPPRGE